MKRLNIKENLVTALMGGMLILSACQKSDFKKDDDMSVSGEIPSVTATAVNIPGQYLAANCFQCHGTNGFAGELKIASMGASEIINKFNSYKTKDPRSDIMYVHAQAYTTEEIQLIADFFSKQN